MSMCDTESTLAFCAFEKQLKTLCLNEFPCGIGSWREGYSKSRKSVKRKDLENVSTKFTITLKDYGTQHEKADALEELTKQKYSPWSQDYSWSSEAKQLRQIAVRSPWLLDENFVLSHFKTLRIVDKGVTELDKDLLKLQNLEEVTLSANRLRTLDSRHLPRSLKVLEVCANQITDLVDLCVTPPPLLHLGLGYNQISIVEDYITGTYWPSVLSLDLSFNNLSDLMDIVRKLATLPKLRNLLLHGNPLALIAGYRGYVIDSLRRLTSLDDVTISADEKHRFKGLARRRDFITDEVRIVLRVENIKNLPMPEEMKATEELPEWPLITRKWYVQFWYPEETVSHADDLLLPEDVPPGEGSVMLPEVQLESGSQRSRGSRGEDEAASVSSAAGGGEERNVVGFVPEQDNQVIDPTVEGADVSTGEGGGGQGEFVDRFTASQQAVFCEKQETKFIPIKSEEITQWAEETELNWELRLIRGDLWALRDFFLNGMSVEVIEEKTESYPADPVPGETSATPADKKGDDKKKKVPDKKDDPKDKKKKKGEPEVELRHEPPEVKCLASWTLNLESFLEGQFEVSQTFSHEWEPAPSTVSGPAHHEKKDKKKEKEGKKKPSSAQKDKKDVKSAKGKDGGKKGDKNHAEEDEELPPPPLEVSLGARLHHWATAMDSVRDEEERLRELQLQREAEEAAAIEAAELAALAEAQ